MLAFRNLIAAGCLVALAAVMLPDLARAEVLNVELGKARLLRLDATPSVVVLGDPEIADVVIEDNNMVFVLGLEPGETNIYLINEAGETIVEASLVVTPANSRHVTVHRGVEEATLSCNPRCAGVANQIGEGAVVPENLGNAVAAANPLTALTAQGQEGEGEADAETDATTQLLQGVISGLAATQGAQ